MFVGGWGGGGERAGIRRARVDSSRLYIDLLFLFLCFLAFVPAFVVVVVVGLFFVCF